MVKRKSSAVWEGNLREGKGTMKVGAGVFEGKYSFASRFADGQGTNPEELVGAAHAGCFSMALSGLLTEAGFKPQRVSTTATVKVDKTPGGFSVVGIELDTEAVVPGIEEAEFLKQAVIAKENCPISKLVTGAPIELKAKLLK
jgi:lipoyl-dependent peroxiredoxin